MDQHWLVDGSWIRIRIGNTDTDPSYEISKTKAFHPYSDPSFSTFFRYLHKYVFYTFSYGNWDLKTLYLFYKRDRCKKCDDKACTRFAFLNRILIRIETNTDRNHVSEYNKYLHYQFFFIITHFSLDTRILFESYSRYRRYRFIFLPRVNIIFTHCRVSEVQSLN